MGRRKKGDAVYEAARMAAERIEKLLKSEPENQEVDIKTLRDAVAILKDLGKLIAPAEGGQQSEKGPGGVVLIPGAEKDG